MSEQEKQPLNLNDLRTILGEEIQKIRNSETSAANVNAITNATGKILSTVKLEMEYYKLIGRMPNLDLFLGPPAAADQ